MKKNIALLAGGDSSERVISIKSAAHIAENLDNQKYNLFQIDIQGNDWIYTAPDGQQFEVDKNDFSLVLPLSGSSSNCSCGESTKVKFDFAVIIIHGTPGEDGRLQAYLDLVGVPYSSCGMVSSVITFDKMVCKAVVKRVGINLAKEIFIRKGEAIDTQAIVAELGLPLFVKPNASGSSFGVTKVKTTEEIAAAIDEAFKESDAVLVEEFLQGREFGCGLLVIDGNPLILPIAEIVSKKEFFDFEAKYTPGFSDEIVPADIPKQLADKIGEQALKAYNACGCSGIVRIDFIVKGDTPYMVEINSVPGMSVESILPKQARAAGTTLGKLFDMVIEDGLKA